MYNLRFDMLTLLNKQEDLYSMDEMLCYCSQLCVIVEASNTVHTHPLPHFVDERKEKSSLNEEDDN